MAAVPSAPVTVPGLEHLMQLSTVNIQKVDSGYYGNKYTVFSKGDVLFTINEDAPYTINYPGIRRAFVFDGVENTGRELFRFFSPVSEEGFVISDTVEMYIDNQLTNVIRMDRNFITPIFRISDPHGYCVIRLKGKSYKTSFELQTQTRVPIGSIQKEWRGWKEELFSLNNDSIINFPVDLDVQYKLAVIAAYVYINYKLCE